MKRKKPAKRRAVTVRVKMPDQLKQTILFVRLMERANANPTPAMLAKVKAAHRILKRDTDRGRVRMLRALERIHTLIQRRKVVTSPKAAL